MARRRHPPQRPSSILSIEWALAGLITAFTLLLHINRFCYAGGLWRDEVAAVQLARMPTLTDVLRNFQFEAFPVVFPFTIRFYTSIFGTSDVAFRFFGLIVGILMIACLWISARLTGARLPLISLSLLGFNSSLTVWGDTIRAYGLGSASIVITFGLVAKVVSRPTKPWIIAALISSLASVHCLLHNWFLLFAICCSAAIVGFWNRNWKVSLAVLGVGGIAALSVLPYLGPFSSGKEWNMLIKYPVDVHWLWYRLSGALGSSLSAMVWVWYILFIAAIGGGIFWLWKKRGTPGSTEKGTVLLAISTLILSVLVYYAFLKILSYPTMAWYYLALIAVSAAAFEPILEKLSNVTWIRVSRLILVAAIAVFSFLPAFKKSQGRQTNIDLIARKLVELSTRPADLIVANPWYYGVTFNWYYHGTTPWVTLPIISDVRTHRYDLLKEKMVSNTPIDDLREMIGETLQSGNRVWFIGGINLPKPRQTAVWLPPAPNSRYEWQNVPYTDSWSQQLGDFVQLHAARAQAVPIQTADPVSKLENAPLLVIEGWRSE